jgi:hypothetical protein
LRPDCRVCVFSRRQSRPVPAFLSSGVSERAPGDRGWPGLAEWIKAQIRGKTRNRERDWAEYRRPDVKNGRRGPSRRDGWRCSKFCSSRDSIHPLVRPPSPLPLLSLLPPFVHPLFSAFTHPPPTPSRAATSNAGVVESALIFPIERSRSKDAHYLCGAC